MKKSFQKLVQIRTGAEDEEKYTATPVSCTLKYLENFVQIVFKKYYPIPSHLNFDTFHVQRLNSISCCLVAKTKTIRSSRITVCKNSMRKFFEIDNKNFRKTYFFLF